MKKAFVHLETWQPCEIMSGPYEFKNVYRVKLPNGAEVIVTGDHLADRKPLSAWRQAAADRRAAKAVWRAKFCEEVLKIIGREIRLGDLMVRNVDGEWLRGIYMWIKFWPEFAHLKRERRGRNLWIVNPDAK